MRRGLTTCNRIAFAKTNGKKQNQQGACRFLVVALEVWHTWMAFTFSEATSEKGGSISTTYSTLTLIRRIGSHLRPQESHLALAQIIQLFYTKDQCMCLPATTVTHVLMTCGNASSNIISLSGVKSKRRGVSLSTGLGTWPQSAITRCTLLEAGTGTTQWTTYTNLAFVSSNAY